MNILKELLKKRDGVFSIQLFANRRLTLEEFDTSHLIFHLPIKRLWKSNPILFQADPFLYVRDDELFLFYELQHGFNPAQIVMIKTRDLIKWTKPLVVLKEPFHLSFPFIFDDGEETYMIPESEAKNSIRLYKANANLTSFTFVRTLLTQDRCSNMNCNYVDSHVYYKDDNYYLFTSYMKDWKQIQELYITNDLLKGELRRHPSSPICVSHEYGRNGGALIDYNGKMFRVSQDCHKEYGSNVSLLEVCSINERQYKEKLYRRNIFEGNILFPDGGHQLNIVKFHDRYIYSTDFKENHWTWWHLYCSVKSNIYKRLVCF